MSRGAGLVVALLLLAFGTTPLRAGAPDGVLRALGLPDKQAKRSDWGALQVDLAWVGLLNAPVTGKPDAATEAAVRAYQVGQGEAPSGRLSSEARTELSRRAAGTRKGHAFERQHIDWVGMSLDLPQAMMSPPELVGETLSGVELRARGGVRFTLRLSAWDEEADLDILVRASRQRMSDPDADVTIHSDGIMEGMGYVNLTRDGMRHIRLLATRGKDLRILDLAYSEADHGALQPVLSRILASLSMVDGPRPDDAERHRRLASGDYPGAAEVPDWYRTMIANGSGSIVSRQGHVLTNHHVISGCGRLSVNGQPAWLMGSDARLDLALVRAPALAGRPPIRFREANPSLGEAASVMGYPIFSTSQSMNYTTGVVSSVVGFEGNRTHIQLTTPIQPGNSGGPVVDTNGAQIAVVVSKVSSGWREDRNIENVGWAIRGRQALRFLELYGLSPLIERRAPGAQLPVPGTISDWRRFVVRIECHAS